MDNQTQEALKMAIEALSQDEGWFEPEAAIKACKEALAQPAQKPVAWMHKHAGEITEFNDFQSCQYCEPLYTHPAPSWQGLSDDEIARLVLINEVDESGDVGFARLIEQALKEKNHG